MKTYTKIQSLIPNKYVELENLTVKYLRDRTVLVQSHNTKKLDELRSEFLAQRRELELNIRALQRLSQ